MSSLITDAEKSAYSAVLVDLADTFEQTITIYKLPEETWISTNSSFDAFYQNRIESINLTPVSATFGARILFNDRQELQTSNQGGQKEQIDVTEVLGDVRIKVRPEALNWLQQNQAVEINGEQFEIISAPRPHGLFSVQFYTFYLRRKV